MRNSDSTSTDHSTLSQSFHSTELLRCLVEPTWSSRDGERTNDNNNSGSMRSPRPSETTTGRTTALISKATVKATTSELSQVSTQDGGNCSILRKENSFKTKEARSWMLMAALMLKTETSLCITNTERSTKDGKLSMLMSIQMSQLRDNSTRNMVFMSKEISTSSHNLEQTDILI